MHNHLLARFASVPALVSAESTERFAACLRTAMERFEAFQARDAQSAPAVMADDFWFAEDDWRSMFRPYVVVNGVLQISVKGVLLHDFTYAFGSWATGYEYIWRAFQRGIGDANVRGIALVCDSPGGEVAGNFDLVDRMYALRGRKPVRAFSAEMAYSAAYSIASVADRIAMTRTAGVGSIGVLTYHVDLSKSLEDYGLKVTFIFAGKHKVDGNAYEPLPDDVKARIQERIDALYAVFVGTVARNRSLDEQAVRDTEALTFMAPEAIANGLADEVGALDDAMAAFAVELTTEPGDEQMGDQAAIEAARAAGREEGERAGREAGEKAGRAEGAAAERTRIAGILSHAEAAGRDAAARQVAFKTDMTVESAGEFLKELPKASAPEKPNTFLKAMETAGNPNIGPDPDPSAHAGDEQVSAIVGDFKKVTGRKA